MTQPNLHRIQRQVVELGLAPGMAGPQAQEVLATEMHERVLPALSAVFDAVAGPRELLRLDRLEIDLGTIAGGDWTPDFRERLVTQMARELARFTPEVVRDPESRGEKGPADTMRLFLFFLSSGRLPWWGARPEQGFSAAFAEARGMLDWKAVRAAVFGDVRARQRLVDCLGDELLEEAIARWAGLPHALEALRALTPGILAPGEQRAWRREFWRTLVDWVLGEGFHSGREYELVTELRALRRKFAGTRRVSPGGVDSPANPPDETRESTSGLPTPWREWFTVSPAHPAMTPPHDASPAVTRALVKAPTPLRPRDKAARQADRELPGEAIYLPCAGIVLLHPFLETLFRERGLLEGREFRDAAARERAVQLMGFLARGEPAPAEYDLVLPKLLASHPLAEPVTPAALEAADIAACEALLGAVLGHWTALRSSSPQWLRTQFFLRDGKLETVDGGFRLTVERRAQDVLLTRLPWGFGVIGLPWLKEKIFVHWLD